MTQVSFYPTYGYKKETTWLIPMRAWVHEAPGSIRKAAILVAEKGIGKRAGIEALNEKEKGLFGSRSAAFVADDKFHEEVAFTFNGDPTAEVFHVTGVDGQPLKTDANGLVEGVFTLSETRAQMLLERQNSPLGWLTYRSAARDSQGEGRVRLIPSQGLSVVSDIDDTIKITEIPAGEKIILQNTFFRDFVAASDMAKKYQAFGNEAAFHYVSGGPWQMYGVLSQFLFSKPIGFPEGTFHMKNVRKNLLDPDTWKDLWTLFVGGSQGATFEQKVSQISQLMTDFPDRSFILIGDSGEKDPEVFREIKAHFPHQVREIHIRDVVNARDLDKKRLEGMNPIAAQTIVKDVSQFDS